MMKKCIVTLFVFALSFNILSVLETDETAAQGNIPGMVAQRCSKEINEFCKDVTLGYGRVVACLYSRSDKLSFDCAYTMYDASEQLNEIRSALDQLAQTTSCRSDIRQYCRGVAPGAGRLYHCLNKNRATLTDGCRAVFPKAEQMLRRAGAI